MSPTFLSAPAFALAAALGVLALPASAEAYPRLSGGDDDQSVTYGPARGDTIVGGATARIQGGGRDQTGYAARPGGQAREGRVGRAAGRWPRRGGAVPGRQPASLGRHRGRYRRPRPRRLTDRAGDGIRHLPRRRTNTLVGTRSRSTR